MTGRCDLHTHSIYSDGTLSPAELLCLAEEKGVSAVALCDHNTVAGLPEFLDAAKKSNVEAVPGAEFSSEYKGGELHILGLFIEPEHYDAVKEKMEQMLIRKEEKNLELLEALRHAGIDLDYGAIKAGTPGGQVNRAVIAAEMVRKGYCESIKEAFSKWLGSKCGYYHPPQRPDAFEMIRFIKSIGAVAVLAHPFLNLNEAELCEFLHDAVAAGLDGMEVYYSTFTAEQTLLAKKIADRFGLLYSGGSDFHGANKPDIQLGSGKGNFHIDCGTLKKLVKRHMSM